MDRDESGRGADKRIIDTSFMLIYGSSMSIMYIYLGSSGFYDRD